MKNFFLFFFYFLTGTVAAQTPFRANLADSEGLKTGGWIFLLDSAGFATDDPDAALSYLLTDFRSDVSVGEAGGYRLDGKRIWSSALFSYQPIAFQGPYSEHYPSGNLLAAGQHTEGKREGAWVFYHENGQVSEKGGYSAGKKEGTWVTYFPGGQKESEGTYTEGGKNGEWTAWHENGAVKEKSMFKNGYPADGLLKEFYPNGKPKKETPYTGGKPEGVQIEYHDNGAVASKGVFKNGLAEGIWDYFHPNGQISGRGVKKEGVWEGETAFYHPDGRIKQRSFFVKGVAAGDWQAVHPNGLLAAQGKMSAKGRQGDWAEYHPNGLRSSRGAYLDDLKDGVWEFYGTDGKIIRKARFGDGLEYGEDELFYPGGKTASIEEKRYGKKNGICKYYYANGVLRTYGPVADGKLDGLWHSYDSLGNILSSSHWKAGRRHGKVSYYHPENDDVKLDSAVYYYNGIHQSFETMADSARQLSKEGFYEDAVLILNHARKIELQKSGQKSVYEPWRLLCLGDFDYDKGEYKKAEKNYHSALALEKDIAGEKSIGYARILSRMALVSFALGQGPKSLPYREQALALLDTMKSSAARKLQAEVLSDLSMYHFAIKDAVNGKSYAQKALTALGADEKSLEYLLMLSANAEVLRTSGDFKSAAASFASAAPLWEKHAPANVKAYLAFLNGWTVAHGENGEFENAAQLLRMQEELFLRHGLLQSDAYIRFLQTAGNIAKKQGNLPLSKSYSAAVTETALGLFGEDSWKYKQYAAATKKQ